MTTYYVDRKSRTSEPVFTLQDKSTFTARDIEFDAELASKITELVKRHAEVQEYLSQCYDLTPRAKLQGVTVEVPSFLKERAADEQTTPSKPKTRKPSASSKGPRV